MSKTRKPPKPPLTQRKIRSLVNGLVKEFDLEIGDLLFMYHQARGHAVMTFRNSKRVEIRMRRLGTVVNAVDELAWYLAWRGPQRGASYRLGNVQRMKRWLVIELTSDHRQYNYRNRGDCMILADWLEERGDPLGTLLRGAWRSAK